MDRTPLNPVEFASSITAITSAFGDATRRDVFLHVHQSVEGATAAEVAEVFDLHANVARHHLDKLAAGGYLEVQLSRSGTGAGRPSKRYRATAAQVTPPLPIRHDSVLVQLLTRALSRLPRAEAVAMAEEVGVEYGRTMAESMGDVAETQRSFRTALHMVADAMTAHGFDAHIDEAGSNSDELRIVAGNCPFGGAELVHPVICAVDRGMVQGMMLALYGDTSPRAVGTLLSGDDVCTTAVQVH